MSQRREVAMISEISEGTADIRLHAKMESKVQSQSQALLAARPPSCSLNESGGFPFS